jgi:2,5-diketo-D-gluconate reductase A
MTQIPTVDLGSGVTMPMVGFGTWQFGGRRAYEAVRYALEAGYRHLDTATMYRNEHEVGQALRESGLDRDEVFVTTKLQPGTRTGRGPSWPRACAPSAPARSTCG